MPLTDSEKAARARQRMIDGARKFTSQSYRNKHVAPVFHKMVRAEQAAVEMFQWPAVVGGEIRWVSKPLGFCVCCTCGKVERWNSGLSGMHTGHFLGGRSNVLIFEESNCAPQCSRCNRYENGAPQRFRHWMEAVRGAEVIERLEALRNTTRRFTLEELVDRKIEYASRLKTAVEQIG